MKLTPVAGPLPPPTINETARRAKMINAFNNAAPAPQAPTQGQAQETPIANPNHISPEELSAIRPNQGEKVEELHNSAEVAVTQDEVKPELKPEKDPALSRQFAQLAKQERQLRAKAQQQDLQIKAREAALQAKEDAIKAKESEYSQGYISKDQLKSDTLRILADSGVSYDELTQQILNQRDTDPRTEAMISRLENQIKALEEKANSSAKQQEEQQQAAYKAAVKQIETDVRQLVLMDPQFETIKATRSSRDVVELIEETFRKDGYVMPVEEACQEVENYLTEEALKLTRIGKIKRQLEQASTAQSNQMKQQPKPQQQQMKTLTNAAASTRKLSAKERAILAFKNELK